MGALIIKGLVILVLGGSVVIGGKVALTRTNEYIVESLDNKIPNEFVYDYAQQLNVQDIYNGFEYNNENDVEKAFILDDELVKMSYSEWLKDDRHFTDHKGRKGLLEIDNNGNAIVTYIEIID